MKRFLAFSLVLFFFRTALIAQPNSGPYPSGPTAAQIAAAGGVTNWASWAIFTNNTAFGNGRWYSFPNTKTAGISEIQALSPLMTNGTSGFLIQAGAGDFRITSPLQFSNNIIMSGCGYAATRFLYVGSTNTPTMGQITNALQYNVSGSYTNWNIGIVQLVSQGPNAPGNYYNFDFRDLSFQVSTDFPCALIAGNANNLILDNVGLFGPNVYTTALGGSAVAPGIDNGGPYSVIGCVANVNSTYHINNSYFIELADGCLCVGNSWLMTDNSWFFFCGDINGPPFNNYPTTSWLSEGVGIYVSPEVTFGGSINRMSPLDNNIDVWADGCAVYLQQAYWQGSDVAVGVSQNASVLEFDTVSLGGGGQQFAGIYQIAGAWTFGNVFSTNGAVGRVQPSTKGLVITANGQSSQIFNFTTNGVQILGGFTSASSFGYQNMTAAPTSNDFVTVFGAIANRTTTNHLTRTVNGALTDYWTTNGSTINNKQLAP